MSRLSKELIDKACSVIKSGCTQRTAAEYIGVSEECLSRWKTKNAWVRSKIDKAQAGTKVAMVNMIAEAGKLDWKAIAWILERNFPDDFALKQKLEHSGAGGGPIQMTFISGLPRRGEAVE
jgi:hypothetical protein